MRKVAFYNIFEVYNYICYIRNGVFTAEILRMKVFLPVLPFDTFLENIIHCPGYIGR